MHKCTQTTRNSLSCRLRDGYSVDFKLLPQRIDCLLQFGLLHRSHSVRAVAVVLRSVNDRITVTTMAIVVVAPALCGTHTVDEQCYIKWGEARTVSVLQRAVCMCVCALSLSLSSDTHASRVPARGAHSGWAGSSPRCTQAGARAHTQTSERAQVRRRVATRLE